MKIIRFLIIFIVLFMLFYILSFTWTFLYKGIADARVSFGFPIPFRKIGGFCLGPCPSDFSIGILILDLIILIAVSFIINLVIEKRKK